MSMENGTGATGGTWPVGQADDRPSRCPLVHREHLRVRDQRPRPGNAAKEHLTEPVAQAVTEVEHSTKESAQQVADMMRSNHAR